MRRLLGPLLLGLGTFLVVAAVMMRFYAYPTLAVAPIDRDSITRLSAEDATYFDVATLSEQTTDFSVESTTIGDVEASEEASEEAGEEIRVWVGTVSIRAADGTIVSRSAERAAFDANTAEAVNCCDGFREVTEGERVPVKRSGLLFKFPFDTQKQTYPIWDATLGGTIDATYVKEAVIEGLKVYEFHLELPQTQVGTREVPASVLGEDAEGNLTADVMYQLDRTVWVEPVTGAIIDREDHQLATLAYDGEDRVTTTDAQLSYTDDTVSANVDDQSSKALLLGGIQFLFPLLALVIGLLLAVLGLVMTRRKEPAATAED